MMLVGRSAAGLHGALLLSEPVSTFPRQDSQAAF
jgi:hypothetical protein